MYQIKFHNIGTYMEIRNTRHVCKLIQKWYIIYIYIAKSLKRGKPIINRTVVNNINNIFCIMIIMDYVRILFIITNFTHQYYRNKPTTYQHYASNKYISKWKNNNYLTQIKV